MKKTSIQRTLLAFSLFFLLNGCSSPHPFSNKTIDVTSDPAWWGNLAPNEILRLKCDILDQGGFLLKQAYIAHDNYKDESVTIENYKANPEKWPNLKLIKAGTRLQCLKLIRTYSLEYNRYELDAKVLDGEQTGQIVDIGLWLVSGDPSDKGSLRLDSKFLEQSDR